MTALFVGAFMAAVALGFVLWPLFNPQSHDRGSRRVDDIGGGQDSAVRALREIEFDRATGKLGDSDYASLKSEYTSRALAEMRKSEHAAADAAREAFDPAEALVRLARAASRTCAHCGALSPEPDAVFCSACGQRLAA